MISYDVPAETYHAMPEISRSTLWAFLQSPTPSHFRQRRRTEVTAEMELGTLFDAFWFGGWSEVNKLTVEIPNSVKVKKDGSPSQNWRNTSAYRDWAEANRNKIEIDDRIREKLTRMSRALASHLAESDETRHTFATDGTSQVVMTAQDPVTELDLKIRPDYWRQTASMEYMVDLKTTYLGGAAPAEFAKHACQLGYHVQAAMYCDIAELNGHPIQTWLWVVVETEPPHACAVYVAGPEMMRLGREAYFNAKDGYSRCVREDKWPGYAPGISGSTAVIEPPAYLLRRAA